VGQTRFTVWRICERYRRHGLQAALYDAARSGRPRVFSPPDPPAD
jgi:transposase